MARISRQEHNNRKADAKRDADRAANAIVREYSAALHVAALECGAKYRGVGVDGRPGLKDYSVHLPVPIPPALRLEGIRPFEGQARANGRPL
jgi:hypothetical protein